MISARKKRRPSTSIRTTLAYFETKFECEPNTGCFLWARSVDSSGYGCHYVGGRVIGAHRASWMFYRGEIPDGMQVLHRCDTPACVNPDHLFLGTHAENMADRSAKRRHVLSGLPRAKLTTRQVAAIRRSTEASGALARRYGVGRVEIRNIQRNRVWKEVSQ